MKLPECLLERNNQPTDWICHCGIKGKWFWLQSDCEELFPSQWLPHSCICQIIKDLSIKINKIMQEIDRIEADFNKFQFENKRIDNAYINNKTNYYQQMINDLKVFGENLKQAMKFIFELKMSNDPNSMYLKTRYEIAKKYNIWQELFDCKNEHEALGILKELYPEDNAGLINAELVFA